MIVRPTREADLPLLGPIESAAASLFATHPLLERLAHAEPMALSTHAALLCEGVCFVAEEDGALCGFIAASVIGDWLHIEEVSVLPAAQGRGVGRALLDAVIGAAARRAMTGVSLTTYAEVPWNAPWYGRCGFSSPAAADRPAHLSARLALDAEHGLSPPERVGMLRRC